MKCSSELLYSHVLSDLAPYLTKQGAPERSTREFASEQLTLSLFKKFVGDISKSKQADSRALELFLKVNEDLPQSLRPVESLRDQLLVGELKRSLDSFWFRDGTTPLVGCLHDIFLRGRVGPGSSIGVSEPCFYTKLFASTLTTTSSLLYSSYRASLDSCSYLHSDAENNRYECWGEAKVVEHSLLSFVPKRTDISRTICTEPNLNMYYQLGLGQILEDRLREIYAINLSSQPSFNCELARLGSINGNYATIDLSSASDSMSLGVLREILPRGFYSWLVSLRTPTARLPDGRTVPLKMVSTMGNGFTFPLETIVFTAVVDACYRVCGVPFVRNTKDHGNWAVFGDDIIVRRECFSAVRRLLYLLGFSVNDAKTFAEGPFRESCGGDFYNGSPCRGVYIKDLSSPQDRYVAINLLNQWSALHGIFLSKSIEYLCRTVRRVLIPPTFGLDQGIHCHRSELDRIQYDNNGAFKFLCYQPVSRRIKINYDGSSTLDSRNSSNLSGLELSAIAGYLRSGQVILRQRVTRYRLKRCVSPNWGLPHYDCMQRYIAAW